MSIEIFFGYYNFVMEKEESQEDVLGFYSMSEVEKEMSCKELDELLVEAERMNGEIKPIGWLDGTEGMSDNKDIALKIKMFHLLAWVRFLLDNKVIEDRQIKIPECLNKDLFNANLRDVCNAVIHKDRDYVQKLSVLSKEGCKNINVYFIKTDNNHKAYFEVGCLIETLKEVKV